MRFQSRVLAAAWAATALWFLPIGNGWAEDISQPPETAAAPDSAAVTGFPPAAVPTQYAPGGSAGLAWGFSPYGWPNGWQNNDGPPMWPPQYGGGAWHQNYGPQYYEPQYNGRQYGGTSPPQAAVRRPRSTRPYWWGPRWQPRGAPYAWNNNSSRNRQGYRNPANGSRGNGYGGQFGSGGPWPNPYVPRQWWRLPRPSPYGYADVR